MITNPWINRITALVVMFAIYAAGYAGGRDQATAALQPSRLQYQPQAMTESDIYWTFVTASKYAGSFYQAMGNAGLAADPNNKRRILQAFPEMVATYGTASRLHQTMRAGVAA
jgi:hypothetical protein